MMIGQRSAMRLQQQQPRQRQQQQQRAPRAVQRACRRVLRRPRALGDPAGGGEQPKPEDLVWAQLAFPFYMQSSQNNGGQPVKEEEEEVVDPVQKGKAVWATIRDEATRDAAEEPLLSSFLYASILAHDSFERALAFVLSNRLASAVMLPTQLFEIFHNVLASERDVLAAALADVQACRERDPACCSYSQALLYYKGYHALQTHRIAHALWGRGQRVLAVSLQSRVSEVLAVDIHPAARLGRGILLDHGTGVVIGETAVVGNNVSLLQNVTLGGTGKEVGDRHPKISDNVLIGASATVLGNITVGRGAQIAAGSLVLKPVPPHTMVAGSPAKPVGKLFGNPALDMQQWSRKFRDDGDGGGAGSASSAGAGAGAGSSASSGGVGASSSGGSVGDSGEGVAGGSGSSSSSGGAALNGTGGGSSSSSSGGAGSLAGAPAWSSGGGANGHDHGVNGTAIPQHAAKTPVTLLSHAADGPAPLRGVYDGDVDATMDEEAAASLWGDNSSDPEYVI